MTSCEIDVPHIPTTFSSSAYPQFLFVVMIFSLLFWCCEWTWWWVSEYWDVKNLFSIKNINLPPRFGSEINKFKIEWLIRLPMTFLPFQSDACVPQYIHFILMYEAFTTKQIEVLMGCRQSLSFPFFFFFSLFLLAHSLHLRFWVHVNLLKCLSHTSVHVSRKEKQYDLSLIYLI